MCFLRSFLCIASSPVVWLALSRAVDSPASPVAIFPSAHPSSAALSDTPLLNLPTVYYRCVPSSWPSTCPCGQTPWPCLRLIRRVRCVLATGRGQVKRYRCRPLLSPRRVRCLTAKSALDPSRVDTQSRRLYKRLLPAIVVTLRLLNTQRCYPRSVTLSGP
jgi:hypothetical protein